MTEPTEKQSKAQRLIDWLIALAKRRPYVHLNGYMERWWLIPYNRTGFAVRMHHILRSDHDRAFHDHPWWYLTIILRGGYTEVRPVYDRSGIYLGPTQRWYGPGSVIIRPARSWHRLEVPPGETAWTLFLTGPKRQGWGFLPDPNIKVPWRRYMNDYALDERQAEDL